MARPKYNWPKIQALYLQGFGPAQIAAKFNVPAPVVSQRAKTQGWRHQISPSQASTRQSNALESHVMRQRFARILEAQVVALESKLPITDYNVLRPPPGEDFVAMSKGVYSQASGFYGWEADSKQPPTANLLQVNVSARPDSKVKVLTAPGSVEIES